MLRSLLFEGVGVAEGGADPCGRKQSLSRDSSEMDLSARADDTSEAPSVLSRAVAWDTMW